jgi:sterol desaturase/sphingolipid hydroxylase (fatty acid hydroxylase superfamily)
MYHDDHFSAVLGPYRFIAYGVVFILILIEGYWSWRQNKEEYQLKESLSNTIILAGYITSKIVSFGYHLLVLTFVSRFVPYHLPVTIPAVILTFILTDFCFYWYHRLSHQVKFLWAFHVTHHSSQRMNLTTAYRINWFSAVILPYFFIPAVLLGCSPLVILLGYQANLFYQFFMHTEAVGKIPFVEGLINTPSAHRVHHGSNPIYLDKNYGGVFMIWDRVFGTYEPESEPVRYGVTTGFVSHNPFIIIFHGFADLVKGKMDYKG